MGLRSCNPRADPCGPGQPGVAWAQVGMEMHGRFKGDTYVPHADMAEHVLGPAGLIEMPVPLAFERGGGFPRAHACVFGL